MRSSLSQIAIIKYSKTISEVGTCLRLIVWPLHAFLLTKNPAIIPIILAVEQVTETIVSMFSGYIADRYNRKYVIMIDDIISGLCTLSLFFLNEKTIWLAIPISIIWSISNGLAENSKNLLINDVKNSDQNLRTQFASIDTPLRIVAVTTTLIGSFFVELMGTKHIFLFDAATFFICAWLLRYIEYKTEITKSEFPTLKSKIDYYKEGHNYLLKGNRAILPLFIAGGVLLCGQGLAFPSHIQFLKEELGSNDFFIGIWRLSIMVAFLVGNLYLTRKSAENISNKRMICLGALMLAVSYLAFSVNSSIYFFMAIMFANSIGIQVFRLALQSEAISLATSEMQGRMNAYRIFINNATYALGQVICIWTISLPGTGRINYAAAFILDVIVLFIFLYFIKKR